MSGLLPVYARLEPTSDYLAEALGLKGKRDVVIYRDEQATDILARFKWDNDSRPKKNSKKVTLDCNEWRLFWLPDLVGSSQGNSPSNA
ncbi:hypothetical protein ACI2KR_06435 [Pseudomonas luteola]